MTSFKPSAEINMDKEKEWGADLGMLDWDSDSIVFTKRSLIEFLKYTGTTVDTNFANIQKLPRYATIGSFTPPLSQVAASSNAEPAISSPAAPEDSDAFKPTRRVRTVPGGPHTDIFGHDFQSEEDALSMAPPRKEIASPNPAEAVPPSKPEEESDIQSTSEFKPSRRVRTDPGGKDSIGSLWDTSAAPDEFKPTRRVREGPGGQDSLNNLW